MFDDSDKFTKLLVARKLVVANGGVTGIQADGCLHCVRECDEVDYTGEMIHFRKGSWGGGFSVSLENDDLALQITNAILNGTSKDFEL